MTLLSQTSKNVFVGDGATVLFSYTFRIFADADLEVTIQDTSVTPQTEITLVLTSDYTVTGAGDASGGTITLLLTGQLSAAPSATDNITIKRNLPLTQPTDYVENDPFPATSHEDALDRSRMIDQQLQEESDRSLRIPINITGVSTDLPSPVADQILGWNAAATAIVNISQGTIAGSSIAFIDHTDTPATYTGATLDFLRVNAGETAVEFVTPTYALITAGDAGTDVTAAEFETLTDGSNADALHIHAGGGTPTLIEDADQDTQIQTEESADEDIIRMDTAGTERWTMSANGERNMVTQPVFSVTNTGAQNNLAATGANVEIVLDNEIIDVGSNFSSNTFTAPVSGRYLLTITLRVNDLDTAATGINIRIVTTSKAFNSQLDPNFTADLTDWTVDLTVIAIMSANDTATVGWIQNGGVAQSDIAANGANFMGFLLA